MDHHRKLTWFLGAAALGLAAAVIGWATIRPLRLQRQGMKHLAQAQRLLAPPWGANTIDPDRADCSQAERELSTALRLDASLGRARRQLPLARGCAAFQRGDDVLAESALISARRMLPRDPRPLRWLGALELRHGQPSRAIALFEEALELDRDNLAARVGLADGLADIGNVRQALAVLEEGPLAEGRTGPLALVALRRGLLWSQMGEPDRARASYMEAHRLAPGRPEPLNNLAILEEEQGRFDQAWQYQEQALALSPDDPVMLFNTGLLALRGGYDGEAFRLLRRAAELDHESPDPSRALADQLLVTGQAEAALEALAPAVERFPKDGALRNSLGNTLSALGRPEEAAEAYGRAIQLAPELAEPHNGLAALALAAGNLDQARDALSRARVLDPENRDVLRNLAVIRSKLRRAHHGR